MYITIALFLVVCVLFYDAKMRRSRLYKSLLQYPACFVELPVVGCLYRFVGNTKDAMKTIRIAGYKTMEVGGAARFIGLNNYFIGLTDALDIVEVLRFYPYKDQIYRLGQTISGNGSVFNPDASISKVRRAALMPSFSSEMLGKYVDSTWAESARLVEMLATHVGQGPFSAGRYLGIYCFNTITSTANINEIRADFNIEEFYDNFDKCFRLVVQRWTGIWTQIDCLYKFTNGHRKSERYVASLYRFVDMVQKLRRNKLLRWSQKTEDDMSEDERNSMQSGIFDSMLKSQLSNKAICEEILVMFGASDESSVAIGFTLMLLGLYPSVQDKVYEELTEVFRNSDRPLVKDDLTRLRYLDIVIKESMRLYPPVALIFRKAHKEMTLSSGRVVPTGAGIVVPIFCLHRNPKYWGPDAEHFDPERFLPERLATVPDNAYIPFSYGPRGCPAYKFANNITKICLCAILRKYKVVGKPASSPEPNIRTKYEVTTRAINDFEIELVYRI